MNELSECGCYCTPNPLAPMNKISVGVTCWPLDHCLSLHPHPSTVKNRPRRRSRNDCLELNVVSGVQEKGGTAVGKYSMKVHLRKSYKGEGFIPICVTQESSLRSITEKGNWTVNLRSTTPVTKDGEERKNVVIPRTKSVMRTQPVHWGSKENHFQLAFPFPQFQRPLGKWA